MEKCGDALVAVLPLVHLEACCPLCLMNRALELQRKWNSTSGESCTCLIAWQQEARALSS